MPTKCTRNTRQAAEKIAPFVCDTAVLLNQALADGESIVFEGAQGTMLDIDHGTYPFVTSSSATSGGAATGTGVAPNAIDSVIGRHQSLLHARRRRPVPQRGEGRRRRRQLRARGNEFGAVTGRPRRMRLAGLASAALRWHD